MAENARLCLFLKKYVSISIVERNKYLLLRRFKN
jgi:hypothetical protein